LQQNSKSESDRKTFFDDCPFIPSKKKSKKCAKKTTTKKVKNHHFFLLVIRFSFIFVANESFNTKNTPR
jgi:hypothetical protein